jgi:hypothetical protein
MPTRNKGTGKFAIGHRHGQAFAWAPKQMGVIATIENAKAISAMTSQRALVSQAIGTAWPQPTSPDVHVYRLPTDYPVDPDVEPGLEERFRALADQWERETAYTSDLHEVAVHQNYQDIIGMGLPALPFILSRLPDAPARWFWALRSIVGHDVAAGADTSASAVQRWLDWGHANGYINIH